MINEVKLVDKAWLVDRVRFGERYLKYNLDDIGNINFFDNLPHIKTALAGRTSSEEIHKKDIDVKEEVISPAYDYISVSKGRPHDINKLI